MLTRGGRNYLGSYPSKTSRYQKCYMCSEIWGRPDWLGSDITSMSWSKACFFFLLEMLKLSHIKNKEKVVMKLNL